MTKKNHSFIKVLAGILGAAIMIPGIAQAGIVYDNGGPGVVNGALISNNQLVADDFTLTAKTILTDGHFWTMEQDGWDGTLTFGVMSDNGAGAPVNGFVSGVIHLGGGINVQKTLVTAGIAPGYNQYAYAFDFNTPLSLSAGTYWFGLYLQSGASTGNANIFWQFTGAVNGSVPAGVQASDPTFTWVAGNPSSITDTAFFLTGYVPAPGGIALLGLGLVALFARRRLRG